MVREIERHAESVWRAGITTGRLRTYASFRPWLAPAPHLNEVRPRRQLWALTQFRLGLAPLAIETGRHRQLPIEDRICPVCGAETECEVHFMMKCCVYDELRRRLLAVVDRELIEGGAGTLIAARNKLQRSKWEGLSAAQRFVFIMGDSQAVKPVVDAVYTFLRQALEERAVVIEFLNGGDDE